MSGRRVWYAAALCFVVAAAAGSLFRFGFLTGFPWGLVASNVRHAHSHLMFFSWVTPALMVLWVRHLEGQVDHVQECRGSVGRHGRIAALAAWALGFLTFPFFIQAGYGRIAFLGVELPWATIISGVTMFAWYSYGIGYLRLRSQLGRTEARRLFEIALVALGLSTVGAWGRAALQMAGVGDPILELLAVQLFLGAFTHGWMIVGTLGLAVASAERRGRLQLGRAPWLLLVGLPGVSLVGSVGALGEAWSGGPWAIGLSALVFALGLGGCAWGLRQAMRGQSFGCWLPTLIFLAVVIVSLGLAASPAVGEWSQRMGLYIVYLHVVALGFVSTGLVTAAREAWGWRVAPSPRVFGALVALLLTGVLAVTPLGSAQASSVGWMQFAAWTSLPINVAFVGALLRGLLRRRDREEGVEEGR